MITTVSGTSPPPALRRTFVNVCKADWPLFSIAVDSHISSHRPFCPGDNIYRLARLLEDAIKHGEKLAIPAGRRKTAIPVFSPEVTRLIKTRDTTRALNPEDPRLPDLDADIHSLQTEECRARWEVYVSSLDHRTDPRRTWGTNRALNVLP